MSAKVKRQDENIIYVNDKVVMKDSNGNWIAKEELTTFEAMSFRKYLDSEKLNSKNRLN
ncbi:MAG: hypothetical protein ACOVLC_06125 [Flavobacterium sp.]